MLSKNTFTKFTKFTKFLLLSCSSSMTLPVQVPTPTSLCLYLQRPPFYPLLPRTSSSSSYYHQSRLLFYFSSSMLTFLLRHHRLCLQSELQPTPTTTTHPRLCRDPTPRHPHPQLQLLLSYYYYQAAHYAVKSTTTTPTTSTTTVPISTTTYSNYYYSSSSMSRFYSSLSSPLTSWTLTSPYSTSIFPPTVTPTTHLQLYYYAHDYYQYYQYH